MVAFSTNFTDTIGAHSKNCLQYDEDDCGIDAACCHIRSGDEVSFDLSDMMGVNHGCSLKCMLATYPCLGNGSPILDPLDPHLSYSSWPGQRH